MEDKKYKYINYLGTCDLPPLFVLPLMLEFMIDSHSKPQLTSNISMYPDV